MDSFTINAAVLLLAASWLLWEALTPVPAGKVASPVKQVARALLGICGLMLAAVFMGLFAAKRK